MWTIILLGIACPLSFYFGREWVKHDLRVALDSAFHEAIDINRQDPWTSEQELTTTIDVLVEALNEPKRS